MSRADDVDKMLGVFAGMVNWDVAENGYADGSRHDGIYAAIAKVFGDDASGAASAYAGSLASAIREQRQFRTEHTMVRTYHIELNIEFSEPDKYRTVEQAVREAAQQVAAFAAILADKSPPRIGVRYDDRFEGTVDIDIGAHQGS